jgi:hypothetical protein
MPSLSYNNEVVLLKLSYCSRGYLQVRAAGRAILSTSSTQTLENGPPLPSVWLDTGFQPHRCRITDLQYLLAVGVRHVILFIHNAFIFILLMTMRAGWKDCVCSLFVFLSIHMISAAESGAMFTSNVVDIFNVTTCSWLTAQDLSFRRWRLAATSITTTKYEIAMFAGGCGKL